MFKSAELGQQVTDEPVPMPTPAPDAPNLRSDGVVGRGLRKRYGGWHAPVDVLKGVDIGLRRGEVTVLMGPSGSGKSTLLHILAGIDTPTDGTVTVGGIDLATMDDAERSRWRAREAGFMLQRDNLIPSLTAIENVAAPMILAGRSRHEAMGLAHEALERVELAAIAEQWPASLSGGEAARVALARACADQRSAIFADEPTGALDQASGRMVLQMLVEQIRSLGACSLIVTHDENVASAGDRVVHLLDGRLEHGDG